VVTDGGLFLISTSINTSLVLIHSDPGSVLWGGVETSKSFKIFSRYLDILSKLVGWDRWLHRTLENGPDVFSV
jgi:hypothetical protein